MSVRLSLLSESHSLDYLDQVPDVLYSRLITQAYGFSSVQGETSNDRLRIRCRAVLNILQHLLSGDGINLALFESWLDPVGLQSSRVEAVIKQLDDPALLDMTRDNRDQASQVILRLLDWLMNGPEGGPEDEPEDWQSRFESAPATLMTDSNADTASDRLDESSNQTTDTSKDGVTAAAHAPPSNLSNEVDSSDYQTGSDNNRIELDWNQSPEQPALLDTQLADRYRALSGLHQSFAVERQLGWDLSQGISSMIDVRYLNEYHARIQSSAFVQSIIRLIGRQRLSCYDISRYDMAQYEYQIQPGFESQLSQICPEDEQLPDEHSVSSVSGICFGDDIARMMPMELIKLLGERRGYKALKMLWHVQRAERQLLNYHIRGVLSEHTESYEQGISPQSISTSRHLSQGPMVICVDTSASMKGEPEYLAKAVTLEAMRVARLEQRDCYCIAFSGPQQIVEYTLDLEQDGWQSILEFLRHSFSGGTDIDGVLEKAFELCHLHAWQKADILLLSDGRFKLLHPDAVDRFKRQHARVRLFGLQLGQWNLNAFNDICHQVFSLKNV